MNSLNLNFCFFGQIWPKIGKMAANRQKWSNLKTFFRFPLMSNVIRKIGSKLNLKT